VAPKQADDWPQPSAASPGSPASSAAGAGPIPGYRAQRSAESVDSPMSSACRGVRVLPRGGRPREKTRADANGREASGRERRKRRPPGALLPGSPPRLLDRASRSATLHSMTWPGPKALSGDRGPDSGRRLRPQEETADGAEIRHGASRTRTGDLLGCDSCAWMAELWLELSASRDLRFSSPTTSRTVCGVFPTKTTAAERL
jgi:hypothetical protein